ncbi:hypothetical protein V1478_011957, partial [Vespula squamosa]
MGEGFATRRTRRGRRGEEAALPDSAPCHPPFVSSAVPVGVP